ncbi:MAG: TerB family tellurite resistance protein [Pseudomonadota bacterium]
MAALLVEAARIDENYEEHEKELIDRSLGLMFGLDETAAAALRAEGEAAQGEALDIQRFTRLAKSLTREEKIDFVERLWEIVLSDGERDPFEDALMRRICGLIYIDDKDSGAARARIAARLGAS